MEKAELLNVKGLKTYFRTEAGIAKAVDGVDFHLFKGEVLGIVGESGSGKSVTSLSLMRLIPNPPGFIAGGTIQFNGQDLLKLPYEQMRKIRGNEISMIFQEPMTSLNPVYTCGNQVVEAIKLHQKGLVNPKEKALQLFREVQLSRPEAIFNSYPHEISGGQKQRVMIAMAMSCEPSILIADEPTTALDVTIQAQILQLINDLQRDLGMSVMLITHDLGVIAETCDEVCVMYAGRVVERASAKEVFANPRHAYTQGLLSSIPRLNGTPKTELSTIDGMVPALKDLKPGCRFAPRSGRGHEDELLVERSPLEEISPGHWVEACPVCTR